MARFPAGLFVDCARVTRRTQAKFLANGNKSRRVPVTSGIRQGCPLAHLIFILVLEALYRRIDQTELVSGITLRSKAGVVQLKVAGYADDTACYVCAAGEISAILTITR